MNKEDSLDTIIEMNIMGAIDQAGEYDESPEYREGDSYAQNTLDTALEQGYSAEEAMQAQCEFIALAEKKGVRFFKVGA